MQIRILAGFMRLMMALAIASLIIAPAGATPPASSGSHSGGSSMASGAGNSGTAIDDSSVGVAPILYARTNYAWPFSSGPVYTSLDVGNYMTEGRLHTSIGSFDLTRGLPNFPAELQSANRLASGGTQHFLLQMRAEAFTNGEFDRIKQTIVARGGSVDGEMPVGAFVVKLNAAAHNAIKDSPDVIALFPYHAAFKLSPEIGRVPLPVAAKAVSSVYSLELQLFRGEDPQAVAAALTAMGVTVRKSYADVVFVDADRSKLASIARIDQIFRINEDLPLYLASEETTTTVQTGRWNNGATPYTDAGIDGGGLDKVDQTDDQLLMILDNGIQLDAGDLSNTSSDAGLDINGLPIAGHRKVAFYGTTNPFGGHGDLLGCDGNTTSGVTHGHTVAVVALGNATRVPAGYGPGWHAVDPAGNFWALDGLAPKARLIAYDGQVTPLTGRCDDVTQIVGTSALDTGDISLAMADGYTKGARIINFSWGSVANTYSTNSQKIDAFLNANSDAMVFVAVGNTGRDKDGDRIGDPNTINDPATARNIIAIGSSRTADDLGNRNLPDTRHNTSSNGPATIASNRIAPLLMAPGTDAGGLGLASEFHCRSNDNDQNNNVECDVISGQISTSFASAAAAGAGLLVRDYFAQGFYPDGTNANPGNNSDKVSTISGALVKAILVASADWMNAPGSNLPYPPPVGNLTRKFRGNREQGFGRIQLTNALPLQSYPGAVSGLIVGDGGPAPAGLIPLAPLSLNLAPNTNSSYSLNVCDNTQPLTVVIAWIDPSTTDVNSRDLDLKVTSPSGRVYLGNFFTDDGPTTGGGAVADNGTIEGNEECTYTGLPWPPDSVAGAVDTGPWSLPSAGAGVSCTSASYHVDHNNNVEAVFLSPDSRLNGIADDPATGVNEASDNQIEQGTWTVQVSAAVTNSGSQPYSIAIAGGVCSGSAARIQKVLPNNQLAGTVLTCNDSAVLTIDEISTGGDPITAGSAATIAARTKIEVLDSNDVVQDTETLQAADFPAGDTIANGGNVKFNSKKLLLTDGTAPESGNGILDVRDGNRIRVTYQDQNPAGTDDPNAKRVGTATVNCKPVLSSGGVVFGQFGKDAFTLVDGGCEKDARGYFTFGFPDRYMDEGELVQYIVAFQSAEPTTDLVNVSISLKAVTADADSPASCKPGTTGQCVDPNRLNNPTFPYLTVLDSPKTYGILPAGQTLTPAFTVQMSNSMPAQTFKVDMLIGVTAKSAGKGVQTLIAQREIVNADEFSLYYSTDYPQGDTAPPNQLNYDINNNEILEAVTTDPHLFTNDYFFETRAYSDMTATNPLASLKAPWNFDTNDGGFTNGLQNTSRPGIGTIAQWGEDKNFNGKLDGFCTGDTSIPCTQGIPISQNCFRCSGNPGRACNVDADCQSPPPNEGTCIPHGSCDYTLGEDRNPANGVLDTAWGTSGGCGWQTKAPAASTGGVWHTGLIRDLTPTACLAAGNDPGRCQQYWATPDGDLVGDNNWWELLLTPVLNKVNQGLDGSGDPIYQVAITDWAWNMAVDIPDTNTSVTVEFDTDINKLQGVDLFNDTAFLVGFRGTQGAISGGNGPITGGFNIFARPSHCVDTDGNSSVDRCGTAIGRLCGASKSDPDAECTGLDLPSIRGVCDTPTVAPPNKCTGNPNFTCTVALDCNKHCANNLAKSCQINTQCPASTCIDDHSILGEKCVPDYTVCSSNADCSTVGGTCNLTLSGPNREGANNCAFQGGGQGNGPAIAKEPYGLATPPDDDAANGYCNRNDSLNGFDKSISCISTLDCNAAGDPYATVRSCSITTSKICAQDSDCAPTGTNGVCTNIVYQSVCTKPDNNVDEFVAKNGPGRNYSISTSNGPDMRFTTLEDFFGDTGTQFRGALGFNNREADVNTSGIAPGYGVAVDDMVVSWKETRLDVDSHTCAGSGECATLDAASGVLYDGNAVVNLTVVDRTPYEPAHNLNDCNGDGDYIDAANHCWNFSKNSGSDAPCATVGANCPTVGEICYAPDSQDCNANGKLDVTVKLTSDAEVTGELAVLDQVSPGSAVYKAAFPYSTLYNSPGTLFVVQSGTSPATVVARYKDRDDGTGSVCKNALDPTQQGFVTATTTVGNTTGRITVNSYSIINVSTCSITTSKQCASNSDCVAGTCSLLPSKACNTNADCLTGQGTCVGSDGLCNSCSLLPGKPCTSNASCTTGQGVCTSTTGHGDPDGFADTDELINLAVVFANKSGVDVDDLTATLGTTSPNIECITRSAITVGSLADKALSNPANYLPFQFKVAHVNRVTAQDILQATFAVTVRSNKFESLTRATSFTLDLDFDAAGTQTASPFEETFETGSGNTNYGKFTVEFLDANKASLALSNGFRCQYNDPFGLNSNSTGNKKCFLGFASEPSTGVTDWHVHSTSANSAFSGGVGRAFDGHQSLHLGKHNNTSLPDHDTTSLKHIMSIRTTAPINLPLSGANPELNFAQQVSFVDNSSGVNVSLGEAADRGVVEVRIVAGAPQGVWIKIFPFQNVYDQQGTDDFSNCLFDPTDDGNNEDSFYDPNDPARRLGPSSTCFPEFCFVHQGQTDYRKTFDVTDIGNASDGPGLQGCSPARPDPAGPCIADNTPSVISNPGTWVRPRFSLTGFAARSIFVRFLFSSIEVGDTQDMDHFFGRPNVSGDDGWYIDDIHVDQALLTALTLSPDTSTIASPLTCGTCSAVTPALAATPSSLAAPGQIVTLSAKNSTVDRCLNGVIQFQFWSDVNNNGVVGDGPDVLLRDWTDNASYVDAPQLTTQYGVKARCSTDPTCDAATNSTTLSVPVTCPTTAANLGRLMVNKPTLTGAEPDVNATISWGGPLQGKVIRGSLTSLRSTGGITNVDTLGCLYNYPTAGSLAASVTDNTSVGDGKSYYLMSTPAFCNVQLSGAFSEGLSSEKAGSGGNRDSDIAGDVDSCP